jgi:hypothetical protein
MHTKLVDQVLEVYADGVSYNPENKAKYKRLSMSLLRSVAKEMGIGAKVSFNPGGIAVLGDAALKSDFIRVGIHELYGELKIMYRTEVNGKLGKNNWAQLHSFCDESFVGKLKDMHKNQAAQHQAVA